MVETMMLRSKLIAYSEQLEAGLARSTVVGVELLLSDAKVGYCKQNANII